MITGCCVLAIAFMWLFPETPFARWLHLHLVEIPVRYATKVERKHLFFLIVGITSLQSFLMFAPIEIAMMMAWDVSLYAEIVTLAWLSSFTARTKAIWASTKFKIASFLHIQSRAKPRSRAPTVQKKHAEKPASNDNGDSDGQGVWMHAA